VTRRTPRPREEEEDRLHRTADKHPGGGRCFKYRPPLGSPECRLRRTLQIAWAPASPGGHRLQRPSSWRPSPLPSSSCPGSWLTRTFPGARRGLLHPAGSGERGHADPVQVQGHHLRRRRHADGDRQHGADRAVRCWNTRPRAWKPSSPSSAYGTTPAASPLSTPPRRRGPPES
jgi:hypothetical protein